ncbi:MAG: TorD/DmsD family molecular chaperone [Halobacteriota archaeon]
MSDTAMASVADAELAAGYDVLARCWREPDVALVQAIEDGRLEDVLPGVEAVSLEALRAEHTRLFVGPGALPCPPYESVYRDEGGQVLGPSTAAVVAWYRTVGVGLDPQVSDLPDHIAVELEFLGHLQRRGDMAAMDRFMAEHPRRWFPTFLDGVETATRVPFYRALAAATRDLLDGVDDVA